MKIRSKYVLNTVLTEQFTLRRKELNGLKRLIYKTDESPEQIIVLRCAVALLYAHWEGFIKFAGNSYLEFVSRQRLLYKELGGSFMAVVAEKLFKRDPPAGITPIDKMVKIVNFFRDEGNKRCEEFHDNVIKTRGNLKSDVLKTIVVTLGLDYSKYESKSVIIDQRLVGSRNAIVHGDAKYISKDDYLELHEEVISMMQLFNDQIENAAELLAYRVA